ncbi:MAG: flagellar basal body L-ring protein FlgH [Vulcanimicrobiaceae bacterium]
MVKRFHRLGLILAICALCAPLAVSADTLYQAAPPPVGPGHPLQLGPDHRASQVGDLVYVVFNFAVNSASSNVVQNAKGYKVNLAAGVGNAALSFLRFPTGIGGTTGTQSSRTRNGSNAFTSSMMATVTNVLPSGVLQISGSQNLIINGQTQVLNVVGYIRPEDIDSTDSVPSSRIADVRANFGGDFQNPHRGILQRVVDFLF